MVPAWSKIALTAGLIASVSAQTYSACNPLKKSCKPNAGLDASEYTADFTKGADNDNWETNGHGDVKYTSDGAEFTVGKQGDAPTLQSKWYMLFGRLEVHMKAAPGTGIVSSVVFLSDVLDEVDWEFLGGRNGEVQTNYYGKGQTAGQVARAATFPVTNTQGEFHNYTIHWTKDSCEWIINNKVVRTLTYADAAGGQEYPQTPMRVKLGIWAGGDPNNQEGTIQWAGGKTDYKGAPYTMTVQKVKIENLSPASSYEYGDQTGSYKSIKFDKKDNSNDKDDKKSSTASETTSATASKTGSETTTKTDDASTTKSADDSSETDFKNNKANETTKASSGSSSAESSASATESSTNSAAGNWPKMWLALGATCAAMLMM
ncbi:murein transglycosylase [Fusarium austroafricanum]|uniref:Crh-like protein n=1 Tax=Fusarium austroafricanum TaxID=2364996 RepID=A0A8H4KBZ2_9HYPO|nr:murein transglycosylase [Fusarium austroafricanum]